MEEFVDIDLDHNGEAIIKNDKIALIDADTIVYNACLACEKVIELLPEEFYTKEEWAELMKLGEPDELGRVYDSNLDEIIAHAGYKLSKILELTGCKDVELHFTGNTMKSFRYDLYPEYKGNRKGIHRPTYLIEAKAAIAEKYKGTIHEKIEADDAVVYLMRKYPEKYILCAVDKDVLNAVAGRHFNYYESGQYNIDMKWQETSVITAKLFPYRQALMGDKSDNIIGLERVGPKKASVIIDDTCQDPMAQLIAAFEHNGRTKEEALLNYKLCFMGDEQYCKGLDDDKQ